MEPAFHWWTSHALNQKRQIINKVKKRYRKISHKYGVKLPHTVPKVLQIDKNTGTTFWQDAIVKELKVVKVTWEVRDNVDKEEARAGRQLIGFTEIACHIIFNVKMDLMHKARLVAGCHLTDAPTSVTYSSIVSWDSMRIVFLYAALNGLEVLACDIGNAYLNAPRCKKVWFVGRDEVGPEFAGKILVLVRALYGLKSSRASWRLTLMNTLYKMGFVDTRADPCVLSHESTTKTGEQYYELILVYMDNILVVSTEPQTVLDAIDWHYKIRWEHGASQDLSWGAGLSTWFAEWRLSMANVLREICQQCGEGSRTVADRGWSRQTLEDYGSCAGAHVVSTRVGRICGACNRGTSTVPAINRNSALGCGNWLSVHVSGGVLAISISGQPKTRASGCHVPHLCVPKEKPKFKLVFNPKQVALEESAFHHVDPREWKEFYGDVAKELPPHMPTPLGRPVEITCFVDADHAGNVVTRRSHTGILVFIQNAPILWYSKRQDTVESSSFGSEFAAMRVAKEMIVSLRYKLRMQGEPFFQLLLAGTEYATHLPSHY